ncbi:hemerythrin domain-containing protein [Psychrobacter sp. ANT_H56B]|uniref:hemerythrin domain-containing protein n=1 Tax=Psychrobacter sp. ANT_H56B TaxID=2597353 RepID=UPI0011F1989C|nr:hemerythrin domain-containing protein [Psychrobacter sp. ANT_H56B]KAA0929616.1 hemerythrin domain-containing protein [Psychrobacter sp. ANT_H56B]
MKRANQLQPLSRQHHLGLNLSRHAKECTDEPAEIAKHWHYLMAYIKDMQAHFNIEDTLIAHVLEPYRASHTEVASVLETLDAQHKQLYKLMDETEHSQKSINKEVTAAQVQALGTLLYDLIRFEERELYPAVEKHLTEAELNAIYEASPDSIKRTDELR